MTKNKSHLKRVVFQVRAEYRDAVEELQSVRGDLTLTKTIETALGLLAKKHGITMPQATLPVGVRHDYQALHQIDAIALKPIDVQLLGLPPLADDD